MQNNNRTQLLDVNVKPHEANGHAHINGSRASLVHLARNNHLTCCGLNRAFFDGAIVASKVSEVTCRNCRRAHSTLARMKRARKWEQEHRPTITLLSTSSKVANAEPAGLSVSAPEKTPHRASS